MGKPQRLLRIQNKILKNSSIHEFVNSLGALCHCWGEPTPTVFKQPCRTNFRKRRYYTTEIIWRAQKARPVTATGGKKPQRKPRERAKGKGFAVSDKAVGNGRTGTSRQVRSSKRLTQSAQQRRIKDSNTKRAPHVCDDEGGEITFISEVFT